LLFFAANYRLWKSDGQTVTQIKDVGTYAIENATELISATLVDSGTAVPTLVFVADERNTNDGTGKPYKVLYRRAFNAPTTCLQS